jgi:5-methylcytosine-specific restriction protein A
MLRKVMTLKDVRENLNEFLKKSKNKRSYVFKNLGRYFRWYYFSDKKAFAPFRFLYHSNYRGMNIARGISEDVLENWFVKTKSKRFDQLYDELFEFLRGINPRIDKLNNQIKTGASGGGIWELKGKSNIKDTSCPNKVDNDNYVEGRAYEVRLTKYERNGDARKKCIERYGAKCFICGFDFYEKYKGINEGFIHVHHIVPISKIGKEYSVNPIKDLRPVCPNCHAVIHGPGGPYSIPAVKKMIIKK